MAHNNGTNDKLSDSYIESLRRRVDSFHHNQLRPSTYLKGLLDFLAPQPKAGKVVLPRDLLNPAPPHPFLHYYPLQRNKEVATLDSFSSWEDFEKKLDEQISSSTNGLIILSGFPTPQWLIVLGEYYNIDYRFLQRHINFGASFPRDHYDDVLLPSKSQQLLQLTIPSIVFIGATARYVDPNGLQQARTAYDRQLRSSRRKGILNNPTSQGDSIIRRVNLHGGDSIVLEQFISACVIKNEACWKVIIWSDAGLADLGRHLPLPSTAGFESVERNIEFCRVFFDKRFGKEAKSRQGPDARVITDSQPLSLLATDYGASLDGNRASQSPFYLLHEVFAFQIAAIAQYFVMIEDCLGTHLDDREAYADGATVIQDILSFDYSKAIFRRYQDYIIYTRGFLTHPPSSWICESTKDEDTGSASELLQDLNYLFNRTESLIAVCDGLKSNAMTNASIQQNQRSLDEARFVTEITRVANGLTFMFLPLSLLASAFGMNFKELGQGSLGIWVFFAVGVPVLVISVVFLKFGDRLRNLVSKKRES